MMRKDSCWPCGDGGSLVTTTNSNHTFKVYLINPSDEWGVSLQGVTSRLGNNKGTEPAKYPQKSRTTT
jgi:hypothetical protein